MKYQETFPIDVDAKNVTVNPSYDGCVNLQADIEIGNVDTFLDYLEKEDIVAYLENEDYTVVKNSTLDDILIGMDLDKVIEFVEEQGFKVIEEQ